MAKQQITTIQEGLSLLELEIAEVVLVLLLLIVIAVVVIMKDEEKVQDNERSTQQLEPDS